MGKIQPKMGLFDPMTSVLARNTRDAQLLVINNTQYLINSSGNCIEVWGPDISQVPNACYGNPAMVSTSLSGAGHAVLIGGTWYSLTSLHRVRVHLAATQTIPNAASTDIVFDTKDQDTDSGYSLGTGVYTVPITGLWIITVAVSWANYTVGARVVGVNSKFGFMGLPNAGAGLGIIPGSTWQLQLNQNDTFTCRVYQSSGGNLNTGTGFSVVMNARLQPDDA
jgi:hypothetical protein